MDAPRCPFSSKRRTEPFKIDMARCFSHARRDILMSASAGHGVSNATTAGLCRERSPSSQRSRRGNDFPPGQPRRVFASQRTGEVEPSPDHGLGEVKRASRRQYASELVGLTSPSATGCPRAREVRPAHGTVTSRRAPAAWCPELVDGDARSRQRRYLEWTSTSPPLHLVSRGCGPSILFEGCPPELSTKLLRAPGRRSGHTQHGPARESQRDRQRHSLRAGGRRIGIISPPPGV